MTASNDASAALPLILVTHSLPAGTARRIPVGNTPGVLTEATHNTRRRMAELACHNLLAGLRGERLPHCVNPQVYD